MSHRWHSFDEERPPLQGGAPKKVRKDEAAENVSGNEALTPPTSTGNSLPPRGENWGHPATWE